MTIKKEYRNDMQKNELIISCEVLEDGPAYYEKMILYNEISGVLKFRCELNDSKKKYIYSADNRRRMPEVFELKKPNYEMLKSIIEGIIEAVEEGHKYLLDEEDFIIEPDCIFLDSDNKAYICCLPGYHRSLKECFAKVFEFFMEKLDYDDKKSVVVLYELYRKSRETVCNFETLRNVLNQKIENKELSAETNGYKSAETIQNKSAEITQDKFAKTARYKFEELSLQNFAESTRSKPAEQPAGVPAADLKSTIKDNGEAKASKQSFSGIFRRKEKSSPIGKGEETRLLYRPESKANFLLTAEDGKEVIRINKFPFFIGKAGANINYELSYPQISRLHAKITQREDGTVLLEDLKSTNGSFVNDTRLVQGTAMPMKEGDMVCFANRKYRFSTLYKTGMTI